MIVDKNKAFEQKQQRAYQKRMALAQSELDRACLALNSGNIDAIAAVLMRSNGVYYSEDAKTALGATDVIALHRTNRVNDFAHTILLDLESDRYPIRPLFIRDYKVCVLGKGIANGSIVGFTHLSTEIKSTDVNNIFSAPRVLGISAISQSVPFSIYTSFEDFKKCWKNLLRRTTGLGGYYVTTSVEEGERSSVYKLTLVNKKNKKDVLTYGFEFTKHNQEYPKLKYTIKCGYGGHKNSFLQKAFVDYFVKYVEFFGLSDKQKGK